MSRHGHALRDRDAAGYLVCPESKWRYQERDGRLTCIDWDEDRTL